MAARVPASRWATAFRCATCRTSSIRARRIMCAASSAPSPNARIAISSPRTRHSTSTAGSSNITSSASGRRISGKNIRSSATRCKPSFRSIGSNRSDIDREPKQRGRRSMSAADKHGHEREHAHGHGHKHGGDGHTHKAAPMVEEITDYEVLEIAVRELAIEHGLFTAEDHRQFTEWAEAVGPAAGSRLVAKAWTDPAFKARLLKDGTEACKEVGIDWAEPTGFGTPSDYTNFRVLEDTPTLHHVIVCTLCSCYPRPVLGMSPEWYRSTNYRRRLVRWPREVIAEFGLILPPEGGVRIEDSNQKCRFMVLPVRPEGTKNWTEERLAEIVTRECMIGVALPRPGRTVDIHPIHKARRPVRNSREQGSVAQ